MADLRRRLLGHILCRRYRLLRQDLPAQHLTRWSPHTPPPPDGWPAVLLLHGGGWVTGSRHHFARLGPALAARGLLTVALDYRLAPDHRWPAPLLDVGALLDALPPDADPHRVGLWGHSAGGHIALCAALRWPERLCAAVALGAPADLVALDRESREPLARIFDPAQLRAASPLHLLRPEQVPPLLLVHGSQDRICRVDHARALHRAAPDRIALLEVRGGSHGLQWPPPPSRPPTGWRPACAPEGAPVVV